MASACLLLAGCLVGALPNEVLLTISQSLEPSKSPEFLAPRWYSEKYYLGSWAIAPALVLLAFCVLRGFAWSRYAVPAVVLGILFLHWGIGLRTQHGGLPLATLRDAMSGTLLMSAALLLLLPSAGKWFRKRDSSQ